MDNWYLLEKDFAMKNYSINALFLNFLLPFLEKKNGWEYSYPFFLRLIATCTCGLYEGPFLRRNTLISGGFLETSRTYTGFQFFQTHFGREPISSFRYSTTRTYTADWTSPITTYWEESSDIFSVKLLDEFTLSFLEKILSQFIFYFRTWE